MVSHICPLANFVFYIYQSFKREKTLRFQGGIGKGFFHEQLHTNFIIIIILFLYYFKRNNFDKIKETLFFHQTFSRLLFFRDNYHLLKPLLPDLLHPVAYLLEQQRLSTRWSIPFFFSCCGENPLNKSNSFIKYVFYF